MQNVQDALKKKFGEEDIKVTLAEKSLDLLQIGEVFFSQNKDQQFYSYELNGQLKRVSFSHKTTSTLASSVALDYLQQNLEEMPTVLVCVLNARGMKGRNEDGTFNAVIYPLDENQKGQIQREYESAVDSM